MMQKPHLFDLHDLFTNPINNVALKTIRNFLGGWGCNLSWIDGIYIDCTDECLFQHACWILRKIECSGRC